MWVGGWVGGLRGKQEGEKEEEKEWREGADWEGDEVLVGQGAIGKEGKGEGHKVAPPPALGSWLGAT